MLEVKEQEMDNQDRAGIVQCKVIRLGHPAGQILLQVHLVQEMKAAAVAAGKAAVQADHVNSTYKINGVM